MDKIKLGKTNLKITRVGFGGIPIQRRTEAEAVAVVRRCLDLGINFIDTANGYTTSEENIGKAIKGYKRENIVIATKSLNRTGEGIAQHIKLSLQRLGTDYIDLYQFHNVSDEETFKKLNAPGGPMEVVQAAKKAGTIRHIGVTSHRADAAKVLVKSDMYETLMFPFNFITSEPAEDLLPLCRKHDMGFIAMKPLNGGMLENIELSFRFLFQFKDIVSIPGIEQPHEIEQIIEILNQNPKLTAADEAEMARLKKELGNRFCRRCDYCQPCNEGVKISFIMYAQSLMKRLPMESVMKRFSADLDNAANCIKCGECEKRCPYNLPIREMIDEQSSFYRAEKRKWEEGRG